MTATYEVVKPREVRTLAIIGLGYVGLGLAVALGRTKMRTIGYDIDARRISDLIAGYDRRAEISSKGLAASDVFFTTDPAFLREVDLFIVTVPTPIDEARRPDLRPLESASETVGAALRPGAIVVYESTVYPGATEEVCAPVLERVSGLRSGRDFFLAYSPERINPGDKVNRLETIRKIVSAQNQVTLDIVATLYASIVEAGVHKAPSIRVAEAAKVIENTQRDVNIALMNELANILHSLEIDTLDVLEAAGTKWNFLPFRPGLVGGHCISVDPYYLIHKAETVGLHAELILAGRRVNDRVGELIAKECIRISGRRGNPLRSASVLGLTFKENMSDLRNSKVVDIVRTLLDHGVRVQVHDPFADPDEAELEYGIALVPHEALEPADAVILAVAHSEIAEGGWQLVRPLLNPQGGVVMDVKGVLSRAAKPDGVDLWRL